MRLKRTVEKQTHSFDYTKCYKIFTSCIFPNLLKNIFNVRFISVGTDHVWALDDEVATTLRYRLGPTPGKVLPRHKYMRTVST